MKVVLQPGRISTCKGSRLLSFMWTFASPEGAPWYFKAEDLGGRGAESGLSDLRTSPVPSHLSKPRRTQTVLHLKKIISIKWQFNEQENLWVRKKSSMPWMPRFFRPNPRWHDQEHFQVHLSVYPGLLSYAQMDHKKHRQQASVFH